MVEILSKYPEMSIQISAHTDYIGSEKYNLELSNKRAEATKAYVVSKGITSEKITTIGFGEIAPLNSCSFDKSRTKEENDLNRRCEFILKK